MAEPAWFAPANWLGVGAVTDASVEFFVDAEEYYADLRREILAGAGAPGWVFWIGFDASLGTPMPAAADPAPVKPFARRQGLASDLPWLGILERVSPTVNVRALLNLHPKPFPHDYYLLNNRLLVQRLNRLPNACALDDARYLYMNGTHHQKLVVVVNEQAQTSAAYVGTMDIQEQRINDRWCEVGCRVRGAAVRDLYRVFHQRWVEHTAQLQQREHRRGVIPLPDSIPFSGSAPARTSDPVTDSGRSGRAGHRVQAVTTFGNPARRNPMPWAGQGGNPATQAVNAAHTIAAAIPRDLPLVDPTVGNDLFTGKDRAAAHILQAHRAQTTGYRFAPNGHTGIYQALRHALARPCRTIYLEDQYLVEDTPMGDKPRLPALLDLLAARVQDRDFVKLIVLCTRLADIDEEFLHQAGKHRRAFIERLDAADPNHQKVVICQYKSNGSLRSGLIPTTSAPFYVHSKTWIFDDEFLIVGSANCNRRGYSHDSELDLAVYDNDRSTVAALRRRIWLRRLNAGITGRPLAPSAVADFTAASVYWEKPNEHGLALENHRIGLAQFLQGGSSAPAPEEASWKRALDPTVLPGATKGADLLWDLVIDPDGT